MTGAGEAGVSLSQWTERLRAHPQAATFASIAAALALGWCSAGVVWAIAAPLGAMGAAPAASAPVQAAAPDLSIFDRLDPFFRTAPEAQTLDVSSLGLTLYAIRQEASGVGSAAIIGGGSTPQRAYEEGDEVSPGVTLRQVASDHVILARGAQTARLGFTPMGGVLTPAGPPDPDPAAAPPLEGALAAAPGLSITPAEVAALSKALSIAPVRGEGGAVKGYRVDVLQTTPLVQRTGLQTGDVIVQVGDNTAADGQLIDELLDTLKAGQPVSVRVERGGAVLTLTLR